MKKKYRYKLLFSLLLSVSLSLLFVYCNKSLTGDLVTSEELSQKAVLNSEPPHCAGLENPCADPACAPYYDCPADITIVYAGVTITYEGSSDMLRFNNESDFITVANQLDANLETHNENYENAYSSLTPEQLDSVDEVTGFDEFKPLRDFENQLLGFYSTRSAIENAENTWLSADMTGTDPDNLNRTFDDAANTLFNSNYQVKIGSTVYTITADDLSVTSLAAPPVVQFSSCITNKRKSTMLTTPDGSRRFKLKVAINSWYVRSGAKGKVVSFKKKSNGKWKRSRAKLAVYCGGTVYNNACSDSFQFSDRKPSSGYKNRKQLKVARHQPGTIWRTQYGQLFSSFEAQNIGTGNLILQ